MPKKFFMQKKGESVKQRKVYAHGGGALDRWTRLEEIKIDVNEVCFIPRYSAISLSSMDLFFSSSKLAHGWTLQSSRSSTRYYVMLRGGRGEEIEELWSRNDSMLNAREIHDATHAQFTYKTFMFARADTTSVEIDVTLFRA